MTQVTLEVEGDVAVDVGGGVTFRIASTGGGTPEEVVVGGPEQRTVTVGEVLTAQGITLGTDQSVSVNGEVVGPDHVLDLDSLEPGAVPVILVAPKVSNG